MRWQPATPRCDECQFKWTITASDALAVVDGGLVQIESLLRGPHGSPADTPGRWSTIDYLWHLVDVVRMGTERLWTVQLDPGVGLVCWDENELARVRQYSRLSETVGLRALREATETWTSEVPAVTMTAVIRHDEHRSMTAEDVVRRTAHEVHHHALDIARIVQDH
jgi:hypothetical protein